MTAVKPKPVSAQGACSREEPQPKLSPASRMRAPAAPGWLSTKSGLGLPSGLVAPVGEEALAQAVLVGGLEEARRDDLVGVDVGDRQHDDAGGQGGEAGHGVLSPQRVSVRGSVTRPVTAAAAAVSGRGQEGAPALALPPLEVAVGGRDGVLARLELVAVHGDAHRAARVAPLGARLGEDLVEPLGLGLGLDRPGAGDDQGADPGHLAPLHDGGGVAQVGDAAVGAGADEDHVDLLAGDGGAGGEPHVGQRLLERGAAGGVGRLGRDRGCGRPPPRPCPGWCPR